MRKITVALLLVSLAGGHSHASAQAQARPAVGPERWESAIQSFEAADRQSPPPADVVVFVGSSSIRFWNSLAEDFPSITPLNRGFGGSRLSDVRHFTDRLILAYQPRVVVLYAGDNDIAAGRTARDVFDDYVAIATRIREALPETRLVFVSIKPSPSRWAQVDVMREANALIADHASRDDKLDFVDIFNPMLGPDGQPIRELYLDDLLHMTPAGYGVWREVVAPYVE